MRTKEECYQQASFESLAESSTETRQDVIYRAMDIYAREYATNQLTPITDEKLQEKRDIRENYKWIKVEKYIDDDSLSWEERYNKLEKHHIEETIFLIGKIREII